MKDDSLFEAALTHFCSPEASSTTLAAIADDADADESKVGERYASVDDLFVAVVRAAAGSLVADLLEIADGDGDPTERFLLMTRRLATPSPREGRALFSLVRALLDGSERADRAFEESLYHGFEALLRVIGEAQFRGKLAPLPPRFLLTTVLCGVVFPQVAGYGRHEEALRGVHGRTGEESAARSALLAASLEAVFRGISPEAIDLDPNPPVH